MKKVLFRGLMILICSYIVLLVGVNLFFKGQSKQLLNQLQGEIYYTKRIDGILTLFKSNADLTNEVLIYRNQDEEGANNNVIDLSLNKDTGSVTFIAKYQGVWTEYEYVDGEVKRRFAVDNQINFLWNYENDIVGNTRAFIDEGSIYVTQNNVTRLIKDIGSNYDQNYSTYLVLGISLDERYIIYCDGRNSLTKALLDGLIPGGINNKYIYDLETNESSTYVNAMDIIWIQ